MREKVSVGLKAENPKTAKCYLRPKILRKGHTGRPVISTANYLTSSIKMYLDCHLPAIVKEIQSHVKYTKDFLQKLN